MALVKYGPIVDQVSGSIGGTTFADTLGGPIARRRPGQVNPSTNAQAATRNWLTESAKNWGLLTSTQQAQWTLAAKAIRYLNRLGRIRTYSGFAYYQQLNVRLIAQGASPIATPPPSPGSAALTHAGALLLLTGDVTTDLVVFWDAGNASDANILVDATGPIGWGVKPPPNQYRGITVVPAGTPSGTSIATAWEAVYGNLPQTTPYKIRVRLTPTNPAQGTITTPRESVTYAAGPPPSPPPTPGTTPAAAPVIEPGLLYEYTGAEATPAWLQLDTAAGISYTLTFARTASSNTQAILSGPAPSSLQTMYNLQIQDNVSFTAIAGMLYYVTATNTAPPNGWLVTYNPEELPITLTADDQTTDITSEDLLTLLKTENR